MSFFADTKETVSRFKNHIDEFQNLFRRHQVEFGRPKNIWRFIVKLKKDTTFRRDVVRLGNAVVRREGGKVSLTILFTIIAIAIGGIGIAGMGGAVGLPAAALAALLGSIGFGVGQEIDTAIKPQGSQEASRVDPGTAERDESPDVITPPKEMFVDGVSQFELSIATEESVYAITEALKILDETLSSEAAKASEGRLKLDQILSRLEKLDGDFSATSKYVSEALPSLAQTVEGVKGDLNAQIENMQSAVEAQTAQIGKLRLLVVVQAGITLVVLAIGLCVMLRSFHVL